MKWIEKLAIAGVILSVALFLMFLSAAPYVMAGWILWWWLR